jgi:ATP adenylyltransferase
MDRLWAPWRITYIKNSKQKGCIFCRAAKSQSKRKHYVIFKTGFSIAILNAFPYNNGHAMVSPLRHLRDFSQLKDIEVKDLFRSLNKVKKMLDKALKPDGYNIGVNISKSAGAGIANHLHIHIVPRWAGDTNFMPVIYNTKVVSQSLEELLALLKNVESKTD